MKSWKPRVTWREESGKSIPTPNGDVVPISRSLIIEFPFGVFVWHRPTAINFEQNGQVQKVPIIDFTRLAIVLIVSIGIIIPTIFKILVYFRNNKMS